MPKLPSIPAVLAALADLDGSRAAVCRKLGIGRDRLNRILAEARQKHYRIPPSRPAHSEPFLPSPAEIERGAARIKAANLEALSGCIDCDEGENSD